MKSKEYTGYRDSQGRKVYVGDKIEFLFWMPSVAGTQVEKFYIARHFYELGLNARKEK